MPVLKISRIEQEMQMSYLKRIEYEILKTQRSQVKNLLEKGEMELKTELPQFISIRINSCLFTSPLTKPFCTMSSCHI